MYLDFCLSNKICGIDKKHSENDLCFNISKGNTTYIYVKIDDNKHVNVKKTTPLQRLENELMTKELECNKQINDIKDRITKLKSSKEKTNITTNVSKHRICPDNKILNPKTGRCVLKTGKLGQELVKSKN